MDGSRQRLRDADAAMELRQLKYFTAIVELGSFSRAAREIYVAQPALSHQIAALETELKTQLLVRGARGVRPTNAGLTLYRTASSILRQVDGVRRDVTECVKNPSGSVSIGIPTSTAVLLSLPLLREVRSRYPEIRLQITESLAMLVKELLLHGRLDVALLMNEIPTTSFLSIPLLTETLYLASPSGRQRKDQSDRPVRLAEVVSKPFLLPSRFVPMRQKIDATLVNLGLELNVVSEIDSVRTLKASVEAGLGCTILPWSALHEEAKRRSMRVQKIVDPSISWVISLCMVDRARATPATQAIFELVPRVIASLMRSGTWQGIQLVEGATLPVKIQA